MYVFIYLYAHTYIHTYIQTENVENIVWSLVNAGNLSQFLFSIRNIDTKTFVLAFVNVTDNNS